MVHSNLQPKDYSLDDVNRIVNVKQQIFYMNSGVYPIDVYTSFDIRNDRRIIVMIFEKEKTRELYKKWCNYDLNM